MIAKGYGLDGRQGGFRAQLVSYAVGKAVWREADQVRNGRAIPPLLHASQLNKHRYFTWFLNFSFDLILPTTLWS
jgi:hypothetical protein